MTASTGRTQSAAEVIAAARAMVPVLRQRQAECERLGRLPEATNREFVEAGLYRTLQPKRFGGLELDLASFFEVMLNVARGCGSSGWVVALTSGHPLLVAILYPEQAQAELFGPAGDFRGPASLNGSATARPVEGGYLVSGKWGYASGIDIATHFMCGGIRLDGSDQRLLGVMPGGSYTIVDDWDTLGMRGTGSKTVVAEDVFVPKEHLAPAMFDFASLRVAPGRPVHDNPMYAAGRIQSVLWGEMAAVAVGVARGALDLYEEELRSKKLAYPPFSPRSEVPEYQRQFGEAWALISMAEATLMQVGRDYMRFAAEQVEHGVPFSDQRDRQLIVLEQYVTKMAADAVDIMFRTAGTSATRSGSLLERSYRDMAMVRTHYAAQFERGAQEFGRGYFQDAPPSWP